MHLLCVFIREDIFCFNIYSLYEIVQRMNGHGMELFFSVKKNKQLFAAILYFFISTKVCFGSSLSDPSADQRLSVVLVISQMLQLHPWRNNLNSIQFPSISHKHHSVISHHFCTSGEEEKENALISKGYSVSSRQLFNFPRCVFLSVLWCKGVKFQLMYIQEIYVHSLCK